MEDNKKRLYQALIADYDLGDFDTFAKDVEDSTKRKSLYDAISQDYDLGDFDSFTNQLLGSKLSSSDTPMAEKPAVATDNYVLPTPFLSEENKPFAEEHPMGLESQGEIITPFRAEDEKLTTTYQEALSKKGTDLGGPIDMEGTIAKARQTADFAVGVAGEIKAQSGNPFPPKLSATDLDAFKTPEQKAEENYFNRAGDQALYYLQAESQLNAELQAVEEELAALEHDYYQSDEYLRSRMMKSMLQGSARQSWDDFSFAPPRLIELQKRRTALLQAKEHKAVAEEIGRNKMEYGTVGDYFSNALTGAKSFVKEKLSSVDPRNRSGEALVDKLVISRKLTNGETLSPDEQDAWTIYALEDMMEGRYGKAKEDFGYIAGNAAPMMVEFMAELALSPGKGLAKGAMTAAERQAANMTQKLIRKYGATAVRKNLMRMGAGVYKQGARLTGATANAAIAAHTAQVDDLVKGTAERMAGTAVGTPDEQGNVVGTGVKDAKDLGRAYYEQAANMTIENLTEAIFEGAGIGKGFKSLLTGTGKKIAGTKVGGKVVGAAAKLADTKTVKAMSELIEKTKSSNWYQSVSKLKLAGHLGSIPEEMMEEYAAIPLRHWLGVNDGEQGLWEELTSRQTFYNTAAGLSLGMGAMTAVQVVPPATAMAAGAVWDKYNMFRTHRNLIRRDKEGQNLFGAEWESVKTQIESFTEENFGEGMDALVEGFDSPEKKDAAWRYAQSLQQDRGFNTMRQKEKEEGESDPLADAHEEGYEAEDPQQIDAWRAEYDRLHAKWGSQVEEAVAQYGGLNLFFDTLRENPDGETAMREILRYYELKERIEGAEARKADEAETDEEALRSNVERRTNQETGKIVTVNILGDNGLPAVDIATGEPASYYVINGATDTGDGNVILSGGMVVLRDAEGNRQALPGDKLRLVSVMQPEQIIAEEQAIAAQEAAAPVQEAAPEPAVAAGNSADIAAELDKTEEGRGVKEQVDAWFAQGEEPGAVQQLLSSTAGSFAPLGMDYYNALSAANAAPAAEPANAAAPAEGVAEASSAPTSRIMRKKGAIDAEASFENGATAQEMADAYMQDFGDEEGLPLSTAKEYLAQIQEERQSTKDIFRKNGPLRKQEKFWNEVVDLLTPKEETVAEEGRQETVGTPVALQYLLEGGKGSIENAGYFFYAIQAAFPHIGAQLQEIRNSMPAEMLGMAPDAFVASNPSQLQKVRRLVAATYGEAGTRILDQMLANSTGFYPRDGKALDLEIENLKPKENAEGVSEEGASILQAGFIPEGERKLLTKDEISAIMDALEDAAVPKPNVEYTQAEWDARFKEPLDTPVGKVRMGGHQFGKLHPDGNAQHQDRRGWIGLIHETLTNPNVIVEQNAPEEGAERGYKYVFVKSFINSSGESVTYFASVSVKKEGMEVVITNHFKKYKDIKGILEKGKLCFSSISPSGMQTEPNQPSASATTPETGSNAGVSEGKVSESSSVEEGTSEEISENVQNATQSEQNELEKAEKERIDALVPALEDVTDGMQTADEFVAGLFGNGIRITPESFRKETGLGWEEQRRLVGIIAGKEKGGLTVEQAAETIVENYRAELAARGFSGDSMEMRDIVIDILSSGNPRAYAKEAAARRAEQALHREMEAFDRYTQEAFHMSAEEYIMYEESMLPKYIEQYKDFDEQEYYSNFADEQSTQNEHDTTRESAETGGSREILSEEQPSATPGEGTTGEGQQGGTLQGDVQGNAQEGIARAEAENILSRRGEAGIYESLEGTKQLTDEDISSLMSLMEGNATPLPVVELNPTNWMDQFGESGMVQTPVGMVKMGANQIAKLFEKGRSEQFGMIKPTLEAPHIIIEIPSAPTNGVAERESSLLFVRTFSGKGGKKIHYFKSVTVKKDGLEVSVSSHYDRAKRIKSALKEGKLLYRFDGGAQTEHHPADVSVTASPVDMQGNSGHKDTDNPQNNTNKQDVISENAGNAKSGVQTGRTRFSTSTFEDAERIAREEQRRAPLRRTARAWEKILGVKVTLMERLEDVKNPVASREIEAAEKKGKKVPGWYSDTEGVFLYLPHVENENEVNKTCVHEIVSHKGLKELLGQEKFDELCLKVWGIMSPAERKEYMSYPNVETKLQAADEYIAHLSEEVELTARERSVWQKIMDFIAGLLGRKADNRSKAASIVGKETLSRKDIAELVRLSYAEYLQRNGSGNQAANSLEEINADFNENLQKQIDGTLPKGFVYQLGMPSDVLRSAGITDLPIELAASRLVDKSMQENHPFELREVENLPEAIHNPLAVFVSATKVGSSVILTELKHGGKNFVAALRVSQNKKRIEVNQIRSLYPKNTTGIIDWINSDLVTYVDKARMSEWLEKQRNELLSKPQSNSVEVRKQLVSAAKVVNNFENPTLREKKISFRVLPNERLRKLEEGETCNIERVFTQQKMFNFSSGEKIESYEDVAYIFRSLEDEAVENAFVALVKNGKPTIVHLGMGTATQSTVDQQAVIVAVERIKPDAVYFVHNHPSGNLKASRQDAMLLDSMKKAYGDIVKDGIIINLRSGKYSVFNEEGSKIEEATPNAPEKVTAAKTYSFSKRVFDKDFDVEELMHVTGSDAADAYAKEHGLVAALTSSQRLGERGKLSLLVIRQGSKIVGNVFLNHTEVLPSNLGNISKEIAYYVSAMGGQAGILYGRFGINETRHLGGAVNRASAGSVRMLDAISMTEFGGYVSALDEGVMEETPSYGEGETRFRVSNDNQEIFVSNAQRAVEGIKQEKGTPQQWLAMIEKNGGLKAGEDKWLGLSDWLKGMDQKSVTKQEILDFIGENKIRIEEVTYGEEAGGYSEEKLDEFNAEYEELIWEGEEETGSIYANDWADYAYEAMVARYGDDFRNAFDTEGIGTGSRLVPHYYYDGSLSEEAKQFVGDEGANGNEINSTRLEYTTEGLDNKQEIALTVPTIESWNQSDDLHFGDAGGGRAVAWIRFGEANDADGNSVLVIDEIQSKRHQEGREKGYNNPRVIQILDRMNEIQEDLYSPYGVSEDVHAENKALQEELEAAFESENPQMKKVAEQIKEKEARLSELNREKAERENDEKVEMLKLQDRQLETRNVREYDYYEQEINNIKEAQERRDDEIDELRSSIRSLNEEYSHYYNTELRNARAGVMPAPFEKNWHELAMKRMLRYAAENGFDKVAWTTGAQQAERYNMSKVVESIECNRVGKNGNKSFVLKGIDYNVISNNEGVVVAGPEEFKGKQLSEVVGVSLADKMLGMEEGGVLNNTDLRIGGEGMKGFYDKMLPSFVQKYTKKWGAKVGEVELPHLEEGSQKMWSVDVTPEMKESVMEGQTMFRVTDDKPADAIRRAYDGEMRTARFLTKETMVDYLASVKALLDTIAKKTGKGITDPQNVYRAMLTLTNKNTQELAAFDYGVLPHLTKAIAGIMGKEWNGDWDAPEAATLQRYAKVKHGIERDRDMAVRRAIPRMAEQKYREQFGELDRMIAAETDADARDALRTKKATMLADPKAYGMQTADEIAEHMEPQWYARIAEIRRGEGTWREKQQRMDAAIADVFDLDAEGLETYGLTLTEDYSGMTETLIAEGEIDRKTARKVSGAVRAAAYDFVEQYEERTGADKTDALWDGVRAVSAYSLEKQRSTGLVDAKYVEDCNRRYEFYVPLRNFAETTADEVYDYLDETYNDNNPVKTARGRRSEAGNPFSNVQMLGYQSITAGNKNAAVQHFWNLANRSDVKGFLVPSRTWHLAELDDAQREEVNEKLGGIADTTGDVILPRIPENATAQQVQDIISDFEDAMKDLKKRGLAFQGKKRARQEYRLTSKQQENAHRVKVYVNGEARYVTIVGDPRAALALNGKLNPESGVPEKYKAMQQFLSGAFTSQNPSFALANIIRDTQHANMRAFITESGTYWAKFSAKQAAMMKPGRLAFLLAKYENSMGNTGRHGWGGELDMRNETHRNFKRFMELGGATGYTFSHKEIENLKKLADMAERAENKTPKGQGYVVGEIFDFIRLCSESAELINRFAAFEASLEAGRSEQRAISDAQEITLNFSRKGAGKKTYNANRNLKGKTWLESRKYNAVNAIAWLSQFGRDHLIFWNASVQGSYQTYKMIREHPAKTAFALGGVPIALSAFALPALNAVICAFIGDDEDAYYDELPDYVRQRNLCIKNPLGRGWLKIPLDPATQKVWAAGDAIGAAWRGKRQIDYWGDLGANAVGLFSPVDIYWGDRNDNLSERALSAATSFTPTLIQPLLHSYANRDWKGKPLYNDSRYIDQLPSYAKSFKSDKESLKALSKFLNDVGNSDADSYGRTWHDFATPGVMEELLYGYTGGYGQLALAAVEGAIAIVSDDAKGNFRWDNMPVVNRLWVEGDPGQTRLNIYRNYRDTAVDFMENVEQRRSQINREYNEAKRSHDTFAEAEALAKMKQLHDGDYQRYEILHNSDKLFQKYMKGSRIEDVPDFVIKGMLEAIEIVNNPDGEKEEKKSENDK